MPVRSAIWDWVSGSGVRERWIKRAPLRLAQPHRLEPLIELHPPGPGRAAEQRSEGLGIEFFHTRSGESLAG